MSMAAVRAWWMRVRRAWDRMAVYLPLFLMSIMAMGTYWLVRNTPVIAPPEEAAPKRHVPDYFMKDFSVKVFNAEGKLKSEMLAYKADITQTPTRWKWINRAFVLSTRKGKLQWLLRNAD